VSSPEIKILAWSVGGAFVFTTALIALLWPKPPGPTFELERSQWTCTESTSRRVPRLFFFNDTATTETRCVAYRRASPPPSASSSGAGPSATTAPLTELP